MLTCFKPALTNPPLPQDGGNRNAEGLAQGSAILAEKAIAVCAFHRGDAGHSSTRGILPKRPLLPAFGQTRGRLLGIMRYPKRVAPVGIRAVHPLLPKGGAGVDNGQ